MIDESAMKKSQHAEQMRTDEGVKDVFSEEGTLRREQSKTRAQTSGFKRTLQ